MVDLSTVDLPELSDGRLVVRPYRPDDAVAVAAMCDDETAARWIPLPTPYTLADAEEWIAGAERRWREDAWATFVVCDAANGELLGSNGVHIDPQRERGEIGYMTKRDARRRGVASGGVRLLVAWSFDDLGLGRLQIRADATNTASRRTIESCGFRFEGVLRANDLHHGRRGDDAMYSLLPADVPKTKRGRAAGRRAPGKRAAAGLRPPPPHLTDGRITLRPFAPSDAPAIATVFGQDPALIRWLCGPPVHYTLRDAEDFIARAERKVASGAGAEYAIRDAASDELIGAIGVELFPDRQAAEFGYWVRADRRRTGVATAAARLLIEWAFATAGVERLEIQTYPGNKASQALARSLSFRREGVLRGLVAAEPEKDRHGRCTPNADGTLPDRDDQTLFALLRADWKSV